MNTETGLSEIIFLVNQSFSEKQFREVNRIAGIWFLNLSKKYWGEKNFVEISPAQEKVQLFIYSWHIFASRGIPFKLWSDIAEEGLALLKEMIETGDFDYEKNPKYKEFMEHFYECGRRICREHPEYDGPDGGVFGMGH